MNWQCRLYGHQWRHPGTPEVILREEGAVYPFQCTVCNAKMVLDSSGRQQKHGERPGRPEVEPGTDTESETKTTLPD